MGGSLQNSQLYSWHPTYPAVSLESPVLTESLEVAMGTVLVSSPQNIIFLLLNTRFEWQI